MAEELHLPVIEARELLTRIENGDPLIYDHVAIVGDIDITRLDLPIIHCERPAKETQTAAVVASKILIRNCEFLGNVNFAHALLTDAMDLCGCTFLQEARFKGASFSSEAGFESCSFKRYATFRDANFQGTARFQGTHFSAIANFGNAVFNCQALFGSARFSELCTNFGEARFLEEADFTQAQFEGTANFRLTSFGKPASFWKAGFLADANFQGAKFMGYASFQSAKISRNADFRGANFKEELNMEFASIQGSAIFLGSNLVKEANFFRAELLDANFEDAILGGDVQFTEAKLGRSLFTGSHFQGKASFQRSCFQEDAFFHSAFFKGHALFSQSKFQAKAVFEQAVFAGEAQFSEVSFFKETDFRIVKFCKEALFSASEFQANARFDFAMFQRGAFFTGTQFTGTANFSGSNFQKNLTFANAKIHVMRLFDAVFSGQINLHNADFVRLEVRWPTLRHHLAYDGAAYLSLAKNFKNLEWFEDADDCYYHYRRMSQSCKTLLNRDKMLIKINWSKILDGMAWISCGYGVRPRYTVFLSCFLIVLFALLFWMGNGIVVEPLNGAGPSIAPQENLDFLDNLYFSAMVFTAKTQVKWYPVNIFRYLATMESVLGWLLLALFLVTLGRTMIR
ncbi:MAG: pentapeptide repeat-containing protein [Methanothrix sp.]